MVLKLNFKNSDILYNNLYLDEEVPLFEQLDNLKEDLIQISFHNKYLLDIGWYPEFDKDGEFKLYIIKEYDWENPIFISTCNTIDDLKKEFEYCINIVQENT